MEEDSLVTSFPVPVESEPESITEEPKPEEVEQRPGVLFLRSWLNKYFKVEMTDGRVLTGIFLCTDRDANIILGSCSEYLPSESKSKSVNEEPRMLGLVMIPGKHIVSLHLGLQHPLSKNFGSEVVM